MNTKRTGHMILLALIVLQHLKVFKKIDDSIDKPHYKCDYFHSLCNTDVLCCIFLGLCAAPGSPVANPGGELVDSATLAVHTSYSILVRSTRQHSFLLNFHLNPD